MLMAHRLGTNANRGLESSGTTDFASAEPDVFVVYFENAKSGLHPFS